MLSKSIKNLELISVYRLSGTILRCLFINSKKEHLENYYESEFSKVLNSMLWKFASFVHDADAMSQMSGCFRSRRLTSVDCRCWVSAARGTRTPGGPPSSPRPTASRPSPPALKGPGKYQCSVRSSKSILILWGQHNRKIQIMMIVNLTHNLKTCFDVCNADVE